MDNRGKENPRCTTCGDTGAVLHTDGKVTLCRCQSDDTPYGPENRRIMALEAEVARMREALRFYGNKHNYVKLGDVDHLEGKTPMDRDRGEMAREAFKVLEAARETGNRYYDEQIENARNKIPEKLTTGLVKPVEEAPAEPTLREFLVEFQKVARKEAHYEDDYGPWSEIFYWIDAHLGEGE